MTVVEISHMGLAAEAATNSFSCQAQLRTANVGHHARPVPVAAVVLDKAAGAVKMCEWQSRAQGCSCVHAKQQTSPVIA
jgi:hypothetical protein